MLTFFYCLTRLTPSTLPLHCHPSQAPFLPSLPYSFPSPPLPSPLLPPSLPSSLPPSLPPSLPYSPSLASLLYLSSLPSHISPPFLPFPRLLPRFPPSPPYLLFHTSPPFFPLPSSPPSSPIPPPLSHPSLPLLTPPTSLASLPPPPPPSFLPFFHRPLPSISFPSGILLLSFRYLFHVPPLQPSPIPPYSSLSLSSSLYLLHPPLLSSLLFPISFLCPSHSLPCLFNGHLYYYEKNNNINNMLAETSHSSVHLVTVEK